MSWYMQALKNYAGFSGRSRRKEYWMFFLINVAISIVLTIVDAMTGLTASMGFGPLSMIYTLGVIVPGFAVAVRRLHDTDHSGWYLLISLIPIVGTILLLIALFKEGSAAQNTYGPNPKLAAVPA